MISHNDLTRYFGYGLNDDLFCSFLSDTFTDLVDRIAGDDIFMISDQYGIEIGFSNFDSLFVDYSGELFEKSNPVFSYITLYPQCLNILNRLPFNSSFHDKREDVISRAGTPTITNSGFSFLLNKKYLIDNYKMSDIVVTYDYHADAETINFIQIRDNELVKDLKL